MMRFSPNEGQLYYITAATEHRTPCLAENTAVGHIIDALNFYRVNKGLRVHAWVVMPDHIHLLASLEPDRDMGELVADLKGWLSRQLIREWKERNQLTLLERFRLPDVRRKQHRYQVWGRGSHSMSIYTPRMVIEKVRYMHRNPKVAGLVPCAADWPYSDYLWWANGEDVLLNPDPISWFWDRVY